MNQQSGMGSNFGSQLFAPRQSEFNAIPNPELTSSTAEQILLGHQYGRTGQNFPTGQNIPRMPGLTHFNQEPNLFSRGVEQNYVRYPEQTFDCK